MQISWNKRMFLCEKEFNSRRIFPVHQHGGHFIVLYTNVAAVMSCESNQYSKALKPQTSSGPLSTLDIEAGFMLQHAKKVVPNSPGASRFCYQASEFCSYAQVASDVFWGIEISKEL